MRNEVRYLLHLWSDGPEPDAWRARLVELASRDVRQFASLAELTRHLAVPPAPAGERAPVEVLAHPEGSAQLEDAEPDRDPPPERS